MTDYPSFVRARFTSRAEGGEGLVHAALGMMGELIEFRNATSRSNQSEELGDLEFYHAAAHQVLGIVWQIDWTSTLLVGGYNYILESLLHSCEAFQDKAKKVWVYNQDIRVDNFKGPLWEIGFLLQSLYPVVGLLRREVIRTNIDKLTKRYSTGDAGATERRDKA